MVVEAEYGTWTSPITADQLVATAATVTSVRVSEGITWWSEARPAEAGRVQIVRLVPGSEPRDVLPDGWSARTRVHEYGGGAWWVSGPTLYLVAWDDQRLYRIDDGGDPVPLTPEPVQRHALRYADGVVTPDGRWVVCVRERHPADGSEPVNEIVAIVADPGDAALAEPVVLVGGRDFVAAPRVSRDSKQLAWIAWDHPNMPWDATELWVGALSEGAGWIGLTGARREAGDGRESLMQPVWGRHSSLFVVSDRSGWWNVHQVAALDHLEPVHEEPAEVGGPAWTFAQSHVDVDGDGTLVATYSENGSAHVLVAPEDGPVRVVGVPCLALAELRVQAGRATAVASYTDREQEIVSFDLADPTSFEVLRAGSDSGVGAGFTPQPEAVDFPSAGRRPSHAWLFAPLNPEFAAPAGTLPPLIVNVHGGPTGAATPDHQLGRLYWTSRGFAYAELNYGGSTGYGTAYRDLLDGNWGVVDVEDAVALVAHLVRSGRADPVQVIIQGGSAGGFTVLATLVANHGFAAGADLFGVADLGLLAEHTHKFESRYLEGMIGPLPDARTVYDERSPINHVEKLRTPLIVLQGLEDVVVPPEQSEMIVAALDERGVPHAYVTFEGEQHGFRRAESIVRAAEARLAFFRRVLGLPDPEGLPAVDIRHADALPG